MKETVTRAERSDRPRRALPGAIAAGAFDLSVHFEGLANPTRLAIIEWLASVSEMRVTELADLCKVSQPRMSWHLRILRSAQLVLTRRDGREVFCRLDRDSIVRNLRAYVSLLSPRADPGAQVVKSIEALAPVSEGAQ